MGRRYGDFRADRTWHGVRGRDLFTDAERTLHAVANIAAFDMQSVRQAL